MKPFIFKFTFIASPIRVNYSSITFNNVVFEDPFLELVFVLHPTKATERLALPKLTISNPLFVVFRFSLKIQMYRYYPVNFYVALFCDFFQL